MPPPGFVVALLFFLMQFAEMTVARSTTAAHRTRAKRTVPRPAVLTHINTVGVHGVVAFRASVIRCAHKSLLFSRKNRGVCIVIAIRVPRVRGCFIGVLWDGKVKNVKI